MTEAVQHLKEFIDHAQKGHADVATQHAETAMVPCVNRLANK